MLKGMVKGFFKGIIIMFLIFVLITMIIMFAISGGVAFGQTQEIKHIGFDFSESCKTLMMLNDTDTCSSEEFLKLLYPPTPLKPTYAELFANAEQQNKEAYQQNDSVQNHINACIKYNACNIFELNPGQKIIYWYDYSDYSRDYLDHIITIQPNILHKTYDFDAIIHDNGTARKIEYDVNQIVVSSCHRITYNPLILWQEMGRIIHYLSKNCVDESYLGRLADPYMEDLTKTQYGIENSPQGQYRDYLESLKTKYKENRLGKD